MGKLLNFLKEMPHRIFHYWSPHFFPETKWSWIWTLQPARSPRWYEKWTEIWGIFIKCHKVTCLAKDLALDVKGSKNIQKTIARITRISEVTGHNWNLSSKARDVFRAPWWWTGYWKTPTTTTTTTTTTTGWQRRRRRRPRPPRQEQQESRRTRGVQRTKSTSISRNQHQSVKWCDCVFSNLKVEAIWLQLWHSRLPGRWESANLYWICYFS